MNIKKQIIRLMTVKIQIRINYCSIFILAISAIANFWGSFIGGFHIFNFIAAISNVIIMLGLSVITKDLRETQKENVNE